MAEEAHDQHDEVPPEMSPALASLTLTERRARRSPGEQWTARGPGCVVDVWRVGPADAGLRRRWKGIADELPNIGHPNLVPILAAGEREGHIWVVSEPDAGCSLRRLLAVATLTPEQAALVVAGVLDGLEALQRAGLSHGWVDERTVHIGEAGQVRLGEWSLGLDWPDADEPCPGDRHAAVHLFGRLARSVRRPGRRSPDSSARLLRALEACRTGADQESALLERTGEAAAEILHGRAARHAADELAAIVARLTHDRSALPARLRSPLPATEPPRAPGTPRLDLAPAPRRARWAVTGLAVLVAAGAAGAVALGAPRAHLSLSALPHLGAAAKAPAAIGLRRGAAPPATPQPVPVPAPAAAGPITGIEIQPLAGACQPDAACSVQVTVRVQPQPTAEEIRWSFHVFDRCSGKTTVLPGASVTALAGWAYVYQESWPAISGRHPLALLAVTDRPVATASPAVLVGTDASC